MSDFKGTEHYASAHYFDPSQENRDGVVFAAEPIIRSIISRISLPGDDLAQPDELHQVGVMALLQALDLYDATTGVRFITYAYPRIRGEIIDFLRRLDPLPRRRRAKVGHARETLDRLTQSLGAAPDEAVVAEAMGIALADYRVIETDSARRQVQYLFDEVDEGEGLRLVETLVDENAGDNYDESDWDDIRLHLRDISSGLSRRDLLVLELYFGEDLTLAEIGAVIEVSEARVSQLRKAAINHLAKKIDVGLRTAA